MLHRAQKAGQTHCPLCTGLLNYDRPYQPNSAEVDHITPHSRGGSDNLDNLRVICRLCNQSRGAGHTRRRTAKPQRTTPTTTINW